MLRHLGKADFSTDPARKRGDEDRSVRSDLYALDRRRRHILAYKADLADPLAYVVHYCLSIGNRDVVLDAIMLISEACEQTRKEGHARDGRCLYLQDTAQVLDTGIDGIDRKRARVDHLNGVLIELVALRSHLDGAALSVQKLHAEFLLEIADMRAYRGLSKESRIRGLTEALVPYNVYKSLYLLEIH